MSSIPLMRLAHPRAFVSFLDRIGAPTERLFRDQGLPVYCEDPAAFVPVRKAWALFDAAAGLEDPALGWHVGRYYGDQKLGRRLLRRIERAPTLYLALQRLAEMVGAEASHLQLGIHERRDDVVFYTHYPTLKLWPGYSSSQSYQLGVYLDLIRHYLGQHWVPDEIGIEALTAPTVAREHFAGSRIKTGQRVGYITVPRACLCVPALSGEADDAAESPLVLARRLDYVETLQVLVKAYMADGYPSARKMARLMDTSVRTMFRKLSGHGLFFQAVIDEVRFGAARDLLQEHELPIGEVSRSVGFDDPAHFARMFRRVGGLSPQQFRYASRV